MVTKTLLFFDIYVLFVMHDDDFLYINCLISISYIIINLRYHSMYVKIFSVINKKYFNRKMH